METTLSGTTIHEEHQTSITVSAIVICFLLFIGATAAVMTKQRALTRPQDMAGFVLAAVLALLVLWAFMRLKVVVSSTEVRFGYPVWRRRIPVSRVQVGDVVKISFWYGIGLHYVGGMWVYNARLGRGVMIKVDGRRYLIGSDNPERLQAALLQVAPLRDKP